MLAKVCGHEIDHYRRQRCWRYKTRCLYCKAWKTVVDKQVNIDGEDLGYPPKYLAKADAHDELPLGQEGTAVQ